MSIVCDAFCSLPGLNPAGSDVEYPSAEMESYLVAISIPRMYVKFVVPYQIDVCCLNFFFYMNNNFLLVQLLCPWLGFRNPT